MSWKLNVLISWLAHAVTLGIGFFLMPYLLHTVGDNTYGTWLFLNSIAGQTGLLYLGFGDAISRFTASYQSQQKWIQLNRTASCITSVYFASAFMAFLLGCLIAWLAPWLHDWPGQSLTEVRLVILILGLNAAISIGGSAFGGLLMGIQRFDIERSIIIVIGLLRLGLVLLFLQNRHGLLTLAIIFLTVTVVENLLTCFFAFRCLPHLQLRFRHLRRKVYHKCFSFSLFTFLAQISEHTIYMLDTILIGFFLGPLAVVPYFIASRLCEMIRAPILQIGHIFLPKAGELHSRQQGEQLRQIVCQGFGAAFLLAVCAWIGAIFFGERMIETWIGKGYPQSGMILLILLGAQVVALPTQLLRQVLTGTGFIRLPAMLFSIVAVLNLILSLSLMPYWGIVGVAWGTLIPILIVELGFLLPTAIRQLELTPVILWKQSLRPQIIPLACVLIYALIVNMLPIQPRWTHMAGTAAGALLALGGGLLLSRWSQLQMQKTDSAPFLKRQALHTV